MQDKALEILRKYWGHDEFRPMQWEVISSILHNRDSLTLFPTGGGKSICFQVPTMMREGLCLVVSPLVSLMEDQVMHLQQKNIKAKALIGGISPDDLIRELDNYVFGNYKFLYLSPERLQQELILERLKQMNISLIAIDEAHCISQWGHDFRPAYREIDLLREVLPEVTFAAFTATATQKVALDICEQLQLKDPQIHRSSFERKNLLYEVVKTEDKYHRLSKLVHKLPSIVYVRSRNATEEIASFLNKQGIPAATYHGGLKNEVKQKRFQQWLSEEKRVMVATTAFGMGIDKANVGCVVHWDLPESLEAYFQEAGRAGRDGQPSKAILLTNDGDIPVLKNQFLHNLPDLNEVKLVYKKLMAFFSIAYGEGSQTDYDLNFSEFCNHYRFHFQKAYNALQLMDRAGILRLTANYHKKSFIHILISGGKLEFFMDQNPKYDRLLKALLRNYGGIFENEIPVSLGMISDKAQISEENVQVLLEELQKQDILDFNMSRHDMVITLLQPREDDATLNPFSKFIRSYNDSKKEKIAQVLEFVKNDRECRQLQLLRYFDEKKPEPCGKCHICLKDPKNWNREIMNNIYLEIKNRLKQGPASSRELVDQSAFPEESVLKVIGLLLEKDILTKQASNKYELTKNEKS
ncbi:MAG: RecQ family ATP-dependent DNA helicase [Christiangramia sp.]|uniref:RecQ family ATP-dependent DNA helicase n=1 Tax=Christiangramia sp. TaxID=1931228 RepID=UPI0032420413